MRCAVSCGGIRDADVAKTPPNPKPPAGFVPLTSLKGTTPPDPQAALAEIRRIYFATTRQTIEHDFAHAIALLKSLPEEERDRAAVYMEGLAQMAREWEAASRRAGRKAPARAKRPRRAAKTPNGQDGGE